MWIPIDDNINIVISSKTMNLKNIMKLSLKNSSCRLIDQKSKITQLPLYADTKCYSVAKLYPYTLQLQ